jgi:predicted aspartyl protease
MVVETGGKTYSFDIEHDTSNDTFTATSNGKKVDDALLSTYYQYFLVLSPEVSDSYPSGKTALKATLTYKNSSKGQRVIELVKISARRYLMKIDGFDMGTVTSVAFDPLVIYAENVMKNKGIPEP